jgi:hypothetical protein
MRVISPPLHLTPAILQACRGAWPRGVISEKTVYGNSYEFKLKGYGCKFIFIGASYLHLKMIKYLNKIHSQRILCNTFLLSCPLLTLSHSP